MRTELQELEQEEVLQHNDFSKYDYIFIKRTELFKVLGFPLHVFYKICEEIRKDINDNDACQLKLNMWTDKEQLLIRIVWSFPEKYRKTYFNYLTCGLFERPLFCSEHDEQDTTPVYCFNRYCSNPACVHERKARLISKLQSRYYNGDGSCRVHSFTEFSIGSNLLTKKELEFVVNKYFVRMRKPQKRKDKGNKKYKMEYNKVFDVARNEAGQLFNHFNIIIVNEGYIRYDDFINASRKILNDIDKRVVFSFDKTKSAEDLNGKIKYFAMRDAGVLGGHSKGNKEAYYSYEDLMTPLEYFELYHNSKFISVSKKSCLIYIKRHSANQKLCPLCLEPLFPGSEHRLNPKYEWGDYG